MTMRTWFEAYLAAFNDADFAGFGAFYAHDVAFFGQAAQLIGRDAVLDFYRGVRARAEERIELLDLVADADGRRLLAELRTTLVSRADWPDMPTGAMRSGERRQSVNLVWYDVVDCRFTRIRSARLWPVRRA